MARTVPADHAETMRGIRTFAQVVQYLGDDQGWPLDLSESDLEDEDLTGPHDRMPNQSSD